MEEIRRDGNKVVVAVSIDELRLLTGALNEALTGPYAVPEDEWIGLIGQLRSDSPPRNQPGESAIAPRPPRRSGPPARPAVDAASV